VSQDKAYSVSDINRQISIWISSNVNFQSIWIRGEISNFSVGPTGHNYFSMKDANSSIRCTFFAGKKMLYRGSPLKDGMEVLAFGNIKVYEPKGEYSLQVEKVEEVGSGDIFMKVEKLKKELAAEGIFDPEHKKPLPKLPRTLGIATSPNGAAIEDIMKIALSNYPNLNILVAPCIVQGPEAPASIINAIELLNDPRWNVDVIIAGRGGGSYEDLMAFNERAVVMAYYNSRVPIVSAVGHEIDKVLTDYAADASAPTPTAAAKLVVPEVRTILNAISELDRRILSCCKNKIQSCIEKLESIARRRTLTDPYQYIQDRYLQLDDLVMRIGLLGKNYIMKKQQRISVFEKIFFKIEQNLERKKNRLSIAKERLENFSPLATLKRGYSIVRNKNKNVISSYRQLRENENLEIILSEGTLEVKLLTIEQNKEKI